MPSFAKHDRCTPSRAAWIGRGHRRFIPADDQQVAINRPCRLGGDGRSGENETSDEHG